MPNFKLFGFLNFFDPIRKMPFYAVARGKNPGIYSTWGECKQEVDHFQNARYKKFNSKSEAQEFIAQNSGQKVSNFYQNFSTKTNNSLGTVKRAYTALSVKRPVPVDSDNDEPVSSKRSKLQNGNSFNMDQSGFVEVFTDGACSANGRGNAKAGIGVYFGDNHPLNVSRPVEGRATNNMAEIQAVTVAAEQARQAGIKKLKISTDSQFLINCITKWMPKWKRNGWKTADGKAVINKTELIQMENSLKSLEVNWNHVRGHVGLHGNEMADQLAREGSIKYKKN